MLMRLLSTWPGWLVDVLVGDDPKLDCCRTFSVVFDVSPSAKGVGALISFGDDVSHLARMVVY